MNRCDELPLSAGGRLGRVMATSALLAALVAVGSAAPAQAPEGAQPPVDAEMIAYLRKLEWGVARLVEKVMPTVVGLQSGKLTGSGVVVSAGGHVFTVAHAVGKPGAPVIVFFPYGRRAHGRVLAVGDDIDAAVVQISDPGPWPHATLGGGKLPEVGDWCLGLGHTDGYKPGRTPPLRLGRIVEVNPGVIRSDCNLDTGDSGGPLFDFDGHVIAIHESKVGQFLNTLHTPASVYRKRWGKLIEGEPKKGKLQIAD